MIKYLIITAFLILSQFGCTTTDPRPEPAPAIVPTLDCRPYPQPDRIAAEDVEPQSRPDGWLLSNEDYLDVYQLNLKIVAYQKQTRTIAAYFVQCIETYNQKVSQANDRP